MDSFDPSINRFDSYRFRIVALFNDPLEIQIEGDCQILECLRRLLSSRIAENGPVFAQDLEC